MYMDVSDDGGTLAVCTHCDTEIEANLASFMCMICHGRTHSNINCMIFPSMATITHLESKIRKALTSTTYTTSFYHICEKCMKAAFESRGIARAILNDNETIQAEKQKYVLMTQTMEAEMAKMRCLEKALNMSFTELKRQKSKDEKEIALLKSNENSQITQLQKALTTEKANVTAKINLIHEANKRIEEGNKIIENLTTKLKEANDQIVVLQDPVNRTAKRKKRGDGTPSVDFNCDDILAINTRIMDSQKQIAELIKEIKSIHAKLDNLGKSPPPTEKNAKAQQPTAIPSIEKTYARILIESSDNTKKIRHINAKGDSIKARTENLKKFKTSNEMNEVKFSMARPKGTTSHTITMLSEDDAIALDTLVNTKYSDIVEIKKVISRRPMVKIVRLPIQSSDKTEVKAEIMKSNDWLTSENFDVDQVFSITMGELLYINCIIACDIDTQEKIVKRGNITYGESICRAYEQLDVLQCYKCSRFGHISSNCINSMACKKCSGEHGHNECNVAELKCINCETENTKYGKMYNTAHNAAFDRCPVRMARVEAIKGLILSQNLVQN